jgi:hypothetical protein
VTIGVRAEPAASSGFVSCVADNKPMWTIAAGLLLLAACQRTTAEQGAAQDARDVAWVEADQHVHAPVQRLDPQPLSPAVRKVYNLTANGCEFRAEGRAASAPVLITGSVKAVLRAQGEPMVLAADSGSPRLAAGAYKQYTGRTHSAVLTREPASLTLRDRWERIVYFSRGQLVCRGQGSG